MHRSAPTIAPLFPQHQGLFAPLMAALARARARQDRAVEAQAWRHMSPHLLADIGLDDRCSTAPDRPRPDGTP